MARRPLKKDGAAGAEPVAGAAPASPDEAAVPVPVVALPEAAVPGSAATPTAAVEKAAKADKADKADKATDGGSGSGSKAAGKAAAAPLAAAAAFGVLVLVGIVYFATTKAGAGGAAVMGSAAPKSASSAMGLKDIPCKEAKNERVTPLVIDWTTSERTELELAMKDGLAVIEYSCDQVRVLPDCHVEGAYKFTGVQPKEEVRQLANADEFRANLPKTATGKVAASAGVEMDRGTTLDIATVTVGRKRTVMDSATPKDLKGKCDGASHIVRGASVGAFAKDAGQKGKLKTSAAMFNASAENNSTASAFARSVDGSIDACRKADADGIKPPPQCGSVVSLELIPVMVQTAAASTTETHDSADMGSCPTGMVYADSKCVKKEDATNFQCEPDEFDVCKAQCAKGNLGSCLLYGDMTSEEDDWNTDEKNPHYDDAAGQAAFKKACDGGLEGACAMLVMDQLDGGDVTPAGAVKVLEKAVLSGDNRARWVYGAVLTGIASENEKTHKKYGIKLDVPRGMAMLNKACEGGDPWGCALMGLRVSGGMDDEINTAAAKKALSADGAAYALQSNEKLCKPNLPFNCLAAASLLILSADSKKSKEDNIALLTKARDYAKVGCDTKKNAGACGIVKLLDGALK